jgi:ribosome-associated translation inhibitor RaiA|tara:strand:+ start:725 stop:862 length:138 start_codon:yes stop_codon:yes gene_type:complete
LNDKKAAKKIIKIAKKHPNLYTAEDVLYAKLIKKRIKKLKETGED